MADDTLKGFTLEWMIAGLILFSLLAFSFSFLYNNSTGGLDNKTNDLFNGTQVELKTKLLEVNNDSNLLLNITSQTDPEVSQLGSKDSVATAYGYKGEATSNWDKLKILIGWVFTGDAGKVLLSVLGGMMGFLGLYYVVKFIRTGT